MADTNITMTTAGGVRLETEGTYVDTNIVVAPDSTSQTNLTSENIRDGVSILGVTGTLSAEPGADGKTPVLTQSTINFIPSTTQNGQFTIGAEVEVGDPIIIACTGSGTYDGRSWMVVGDVMSFTSTSHVAVVDVTGVTETTGEQGPQGEQGATGSPGAAGADGEDGEPPVIATQDSYSGVPVTGTSQQYTLDTWSRVPASGDDIMIMVAGQAGTASADRTFISVGTVVSATSQSPNYAVTVNVVGVQETTGQAGADGEAGLLYSGIALATPVVGSTLTVPTGSFNRTPVVGEEGLGLFTYNEKSYFCGYSVQDTSAGIVVNVNTVVDLSNSGDVTELTAQQIRIYDLDEGVYKWTNTGTRTILYNGESGTETTSGGSAGTAYLYVYNLNTEGTSKAWWMFYGSSTSMVYVKFGTVSSTSGLFYVKSLMDIPNLNQLLPAPTEETAGYVAQINSAGTAWEAAPLSTPSINLKIENGLIGYYSTTSDPVVSSTAIPIIYTSFPGMDSNKEIGGLPLATGAPGLLIWKNTSTNDVFLCTFTVGSGPVLMVGVVITNVIKVQDQGGLFFDGVFTSTPTTTGSFSLTTSYFSRTPVQGDKFIGIGSTNVQPVTPYIVGGTISGMTSAMATVTFDFVQELGGGGSGGGITELTDQTIQLWTLNSGLYYLTYDGVKRLLYNGADESKITAINSRVAYLFVSRESDTATQWHLFFQNSAGMMTLRFGKSTTTSGTTNNRYLNYLPEQADQILPEASSDIAGCIPRVNSSGTAWEVVEQPFLSSDTAGQSTFSTISNIVTTTQGSPDASSLPEGTLVIKIAS